MSLIDIVFTEFNRIRKSKETNSILDVSYKTLSDAALRRVEFWLKRIATFIYRRRPPIPSAHTEIPKRMKSALKKYICPTEQDAQDTYYMFKEFVVFLLRNYRPKNKLSSVLTVDAIDQSVYDPNGPMYQYLQELMAIRSLPYLENGKACERRK